MERRGLEAAPRRIPPLILLLVLFFVSAGNTATSSGLQPPASTGVIEGQITMRAQAASRTADRYVASTGEARDIPQVPVIVRIEGAVPEAGPARPSSPLQLLQKDETFTPLLLVVPVGGTVSFPNADPLFHNVFSYSRPKRFDLGRYPRGESKNVTFDRPGYVKVMCEVHKWMRAAIVVVENPYYAVVDETGRYRIAGVSPGRYRISVEHFDKRTHSAEVDVPSGGTVRFDLTL